MMDNEASTSFKGLLQKMRKVVQLAPPHSHRRNTVECANAHLNFFVAGLASVDSNFPICLWCKLLKKEEITINLLKTSRTNPRSSVYVQIFGAFYFNATPMTPPETKIMHMKTKST